MDKILIGKKIGMTQIFDQNTGKTFGVTVLEVADNVVSRLIDETHYEVGKGKKKKPLKSETGNYKGLNFVPEYIFVTKKGKDDQVEIGTPVNTSDFQVGLYVDITTTTKGKGFQGVMKRWGFKGGKATHGQSDRARAAGSIGSGTTIGRVFKGQKMAGHKGNVKQTVKNMQIVHVDVENNLIAVRGSVPGNKKATVIIRESFKNKLKK